MKHQSPLRSNHKQPCNVSFNYMYRDASNWKDTGCVVFRGDKMSISVANKRLAATFDSGRHFIAHQIDIPEVFIWNPLADYNVDDPPANLVPGKYVISDDDHCWHEFDFLQRTTDEATDRRTLTEFVEAVESAAEQGWDDSWEPSDRRPGGLRNSDGCRSEMASVGTLSEQILDLSHKSSDHAVRM